MRLIIPAVITLLVFSQCTKREIINITEHINYIDDSNSVPYFNGVTTIQMENYVNKLYIDFLGREPSNTERNDAVNTFKNNGIDSATRANMVAQIQSLPEYYDQFSKTNLNALLGGFDSLRIVDEIAFLQFLSDSYTQAGQEQLAQFYDYEIVKLTNANNAAYNLEQGNISLNQYYGYLIYNYIYDQINMGSLNFVLAGFEGLLKRLPTDAEETAAVSMVDGISAHLFLQDGNSKGDFVNIVTHTDGFYEGRIIDIYLRLLARNPSSTEMSLTTINFKNAVLDFQDIERIVAVSQEYAGF